MKAVLFGLVAALSCSTAQAVPSTLPASNQSLTPVGAILDGNKAGTIPPWTGGITTRPKSYRRGAHHPDPFAQDQVQISIDAKNLATYQHQLSQGTIALIKNNPGFKLNIYPTHRSASLPEHIYRSTQQNIDKAQLTFRGNGVSGVTSGIPFPIPKSGQEAIWNHTMRYRGENVVIVTNRAVVQPDGRQSMSKLKRSVYFNYGRRGLKEADLDNTLFYYKHKIIEPVRSAGSALLIRETIDQINSPRKAWQYSAGQRRVRRLPKLDYQDVMPDTSGMLTIDSADMFNGALDRYDWNLVGRQEFYIPYNSYKLHSGEVSYQDIIRPGTLNPELLRYELHRVWVVDATLRTGFKHPYAKRRFYLDEDSWQIVMVDIYNDENKLIRYQEAHPINYYEVPALVSTAEVIYDFESGRYFVDGLNNQDAEYDFSPRLKKRSFTSSALRREGR